MHPRYPVLVSEGVSRALVLSLFISHSPVNMPALLSFFIPPLPRVTKCEFEELTAYLLTYEPLPMFRCPGSRLAGFSLIT